MQQIQKMDLQLSHNNILKVTEKEKSMNWKCINISIDYRLVKNTLNEKDDKKKREVVKKVIAYMTLGIL